MSESARDLPSKAKGALDFFFAEWPMSRVWLLELDTDKELSPRGRPFLKDAAF